MKEVKGLKYYAERFKSGDTSIFDELITYKEYPEKNRHGKNDTIKRVQFTDIALNKLYEVIKNEFYFVEINDIESIFLEFVYDKLFNLIDITYEPKQIISFTYDKAFGFVYNKIKTIEKYKQNDNKKNIYISTDHLDKDDDDDDENKRYSPFDTYQKNKWLYDIGENQFYEDFITTVGGIENLLTKKQYEIYKLLQSNYTQEKIAEIYGCSQENISKQKAKIEKELKRHYYAYRTIKNKNNESTYNRIESFLTYYFQLNDYITDDKFDIFGFTIEFINRQYQEEMSESVNYTYLHKNKRDYTVTILDVLSEYMSQTQWIKLHNHLKGKAIIIHNREKDRMVKYIIKAFMDYNKDITERIVKYYNNYTYLQSFAN